MRRILHIKELLKTSAKPLRAVEKARRAAPFCIKYRVRAGMAVEAALVMPFYIFFLINLLYSIEMIRLQSTMETALHQVGNQICYYTWYYRNAAGDSIEISEFGEAAISFVLSQTYVKSKAEELAGRDYLAASPLTDAGISFLRSSILNEDDEVKIIADYKAQAMIPLISYDGIWLETRYFGHAWTGYRISDTEEDQEEADVETVYVTDAGAVYHRSRDCRYLNPSVKTVNVSELSGLRSNDGSCYYPCESCSPGKNGAVYVTNFGNRYHSRRDCSGIKRTIREVSLNSVKDVLPACSACGK